MSHTHVMASDELIECNELPELAHALDWDEGYIVWYVGCVRKPTVRLSSWYYPPRKNGEPDPRGHGACEKAIESLRQGLTVYQPLAGQMQARAERAEAALAASQAEVERLRAGIQRHIQHGHDNRGSLERLLHDVVEGEQT